ncbi:MAG: energy transducer TonB [candidate division Zixibacteria bacterium]|nr:energy transducer TonB [candidate division Zixibacteria bacterium]
MKSTFTATVAVLLLVPMLVLVASAGEELAKDPSPDQFIPVDKPAEMTYQTTPTYPTIAVEMGVEGTVWIKTLVGKNGKAKKSIVAKSSGSKVLDDAALKAAAKNRFNPAYRDAQPVAVWLSYKVTFKL